MSTMKEEINWVFNSHSKIMEIFDNSQANKEDWASKLDKFFADKVPHIYKNLPWLNETPLHSLRPNQLVRFRGMIQDMQDPEFYMETYLVKLPDGSEVLRPGRYMDVVSCSPGEEILLNSSSCETKDRNSYMCISVPGENKWVKEVYVDQNPKSETSMSPRKDKEVNCKRRLPDNEIEEDLYMESCTNQVDGKKLKDQNTPVSGNKESGSLCTESKFPFSTTNGIVCMLKVYNEHDLKLNDIVEVAGILSLDSLPASCEKESLFDSEMEGPTLPPSLAPRLHVLSIQKKHHYNPLLPSVVTKEKFPFSNIRELIGSVFDAAFLGDELAAEYFICHLISSVYMRQDIVPLGKFSVNLSGITQELQAQDYPRQLYNLLQSLTTHSHLFAMTLNNMNKMDFVPKKDYQKNSLTSGFLQMPPDLNLVVDETQLSAGQLDTKGISNLTALGTLINWQKVDYDFQFHNIEQHTNVPVLVLSEGKSMINCDCQIRFDPKHTDVSLAFSQVSSLLTPKVLENLRIYLTLSRLAPYTMSEDMQQTVQNDFVSSRRHEGGMTSDDLHSLLTLAKLLAQSCGKLELTEDIWKSAKMLEGERKGRLTNNN